MSDVNTENTKTATERLEDLERSISQILQTVQPMDLIVRDIMWAKEALKLLNNKLDSVVKALTSGEPVTEEAIDRIMAENNAKELADKVSQMVAYNLLVSSDTVTDASFVVLNETDSTGKVVNPRLQFLVSQLQDEDLKSKVVGAKVGSSILVGEQGNSLNVLESYSVVVPTATSVAAPAAESSPIETSSSATSSEPSSETSLETAVVSA